MAAACSRQPMATLSPSGMATILTRWMLPLALLCLGPCRAAPTLRKGSSRLPRRVPFLLGQHQQAALERPSCCSDVHFLLGDSTGSAQESHVAKFASPPCHILKAKRFEGPASAHCIAAGHVHRTMRWITCAICVR